MLGLLRLCGPGGVLRILESLQGAVRDFGVEENDGFPAMLSDAHRAAVRVINCLRPLLPSLGCWNLLHR